MEVKVEQEANFRIQALAKCLQTLKVPTMEAVTKIIHLQASPR